MKIEQLIVQHLYNNKVVILQGIGTIHLNPAIVLPAASDKENQVPDNAFTFEYNLRAPEDPALVDFIVQQTRKIRPLASSDLESYSILAKQFLNIGKPLVIEGVGTIQKNQSGLYEFIQGNFITPKIDDIPKQAREKREENISFESEAKNTGSNRTYVIIGFVSIFVILVCLGLFYYIFKAQTTVPEPVALTQIPVVDTTVKADTNTVIAPDTGKAVVDPVPIKTDSFNFKVVLKDYPNEATANKAFAKLSEYGHKLQVIKVDSARYQVAMPFTTPLADTLRARDSLRKFFGGKPYVIQ